MIKTERKQRMTTNNNSNKNKLSQLKTLLAMYQIYSLQNSLAREREIEKPLDDKETYKNNDNSDYKIQKNKAIKIV